MFVFSSHTSDISVHKELAIDADTLSLSFYNKYHRPSSYILIKLTETGVASLLLVSLGEKL